MKKFWIYKKRREIRLLRGHMQTQMMIFQARMPGGELFLGDMSYRNGTRDISILPLYALRGRGKKVMGSTVGNYRKIEVSLQEAEKTLDRFERICC